MLCFVCIWNITSYDSKGGLNKGGLRDFGSIFFIKLLWLEIFSNNNFPLHLFYFPPTRTFHCICFIFLQQQLSIAFVLFSSKNNFPLHLFYFPPTTTFHCICFIFFQQQLSIAFVLFSFNNNFPLHLFYFPSTTTFHCICFIFLQQQLSISSTCLFNVIHNLTNSTLLKCTTMWVEN